LPEPKIKSVEQFWERLPTVKAVIVELDADEHSYRKQVFQNRKKKRSPWDLT
jgi:hypothetical protein